MKTKLLKKIRKRYSIVYFPYGFDAPFSNPLGRKYCVPNFWIGVFKETKQDCLEYILRKVRKRYAKYSRTYKERVNGVKIWP